MVAPPRGERGLKLHDVEFDGTNDAVAPPRGERGLKYYGVYLEYAHERKSLPLVGSVD